MGMEQSPSEQFTDRFKSKPRDPKEDAIESMSFSDLVPEAVKHVTGSDVAALVSSVVSPSSAIKSGIKQTKRLFKPLETFKGFSEEEIRKFHNRLGDIYDEGFSPQEAFEAAMKNASSKEKAVLRALQKDDFLGFDYPHQALRGLLEDPSAWELSPNLKGQLTKLGSTATPIKHIKIEKVVNNTPTVKSTTHGMMDSSEEFMNWQEIRRAQGVERYIVRQDGTSTKLIGTGARDYKVPEGSVVVDRLPDGQMLLQDIGKGIKREQVEGVLNRAKQKFEK